jgi:cell division protease FtsH
MATTRTPSSLAATSPARRISEETARRIDAEIQRIVTEQYERATKIITEHRSALDKIAEALLEHETIEGRHVLEILEFGEMRSPIAVAFVGKPAEKLEDKKPADKPRPPRASAPRGPTPAPTPA